jgi:two-component system NarL family sensor kinase
MPSPPWAGPMHTTQSLRAWTATRTDTAALITALAAAAMLAAAAAFVAWRIATPTDGGVGAYVTSSWTSTGLAVSRLPGTHTPLQDGDRVTTIGGQPLAAWQPAGGGLIGSTTGTGRALAYSVLRDGRPAELQVPLAPYPLLEVLASQWATLLWLGLMLVVAGYLFARRPHEPATRPLLLLATALAGSTVPWILSIGPSDLVADGPGVPLFLIATFFIYLVAWSAALHFALVFPRPLPVAGPRRSHLAAVYLLPPAVQLAWIAGTYPGAATSLGWIGSWTTAQLAIVPILILAALAGLVAQWRGADAPGRARLRWIGAAAAFALGGGLLGWFLPTALTGTALLPWSAIGVTGLPFPLAVGLAVSRHRLFGIETLLRRSLVYGGLTVGVLLTYAASVVLLSTMLPGDGPYAVTLLATGAAALVALPLRDRLQRGVNRLLYGDRDEPYRAIARLGERMGATLDPDSVLPTVAETVAQALRLPYAAIELRHGAGTEIAAAHGSPRPGFERLPLIHRGEAIGWLVLARRASDEPFSPADRALLLDLTHQVAAAAFAVRLTAELRRSRERLVSAREEERRRLRRDLHDGVGPTLAGSLMKVEAARRLVGRASPEELERLLDELARETRVAIDDVRRLAYELRPTTLDQLGLGGALEQEADRLGGDRIAMNVASAALPPLPAAVEVAAYRIGVESLTNVVHHSGARRAWLELRLEPGLLVVETRDDGTGRPADIVPGIGLTAMRERAEELGGQLAVSTAREGGLRVLATLPLSLGPAGA